MTLLQSWAQTLNSPSAVATFVQRLHDAAGIDTCILDPEMLLGIIERQHQAGVELTSLRRDAVLAALRRANTVAPN